MKKKKRGSSLPDDSNVVRLQAFLAHCGVASRRASEKIILDGRVQVNGKVVTELGTKVSANDVVLVDGKQVFVEENKRYVLLNKPVGYVCTQSDEKGRQTAAELLQSSYSERLYNVGRLDMLSCGIIIFTNDGDFARRLSHPSAEVEKEYVVTSVMPFPRDLAENFKKGVRVDGVFYRAKSAEEITPRKMRVILIEGKNREIRRVFADAGVQIKMLKRVRIGNIQIGNLNPGEFRDLTEDELKSLLSLCKN